MICSSLTFVAHFSRKTWTPLISSHMTIMSRLVCVVLFVLCTSTSAAYNTNAIPQPPDHVLRYEPMKPSFSNVETKPYDGYKVHITFMNHLDVGYDGILPTIGFVNNVLNRYFVDYFPRAARLYDELKRGGYEETFKYTTHPWLVMLYLNCPPDFWSAGIQLICPNKTELATFERAVREGAVAWHAGPMNLQMENQDGWLFDYGVDIAARLDRRFGIRRRTRVLSQRDVPGMTRGVVPRLVRAGVSAVTVGVNQATAPPAVPLPFRWQAYKGSKDEVIGIWHKGGYPDNAGPDPAHPGGLSKKDCVVIPGFKHVLCYAFRTDNSGPPVTVSELLGYYEILRVEFPGAQLAASTFEEYVEQLLPLRSRLPVLSGEIGDTWIVGVSSDPRKTAEYRAMSRALKRCLQRKQCDVRDVRLSTALFLFTKLPEHTWGIPSVYDNVNWTNTKFEKLRTTDMRYINCSMSWYEQRNFTYKAVQALGSHPVVTDIKREFGQLVARKPDLSKYVKVKNPKQIFKCAKSMAVAFGGDGSIVKLTSSDGVEWASSSHPLAQFMYKTYNHTDFAALAKRYDYHGDGTGFYKHNATIYAKPESKWWPVTLTDLYQAKVGCSYHARLTVSDPRAHTYYGAPEEVWVSVAVSDGGVAVDVQMFNKTSTRLAEGVYVNFRPPPQQDYVWLLNKLDASVSPRDVILNGSQHQHAVRELGASYLRGRAGRGQTLLIHSPDVALACVYNTTQQPSVFPALTPIQGPVAGVAYNIYNNIWDTNYIFWYPYMKGDENMRARFDLLLVPQPGDTTQVFNRPVPPLNRPL